MKDDEKTTFMVASWVYFELKHILRKKINSIKYGIDKKRGLIGNYHFPKKYAGKSVFSRNATNEYIYKLIHSGRPFAIGRLGGCEMEMIAYWKRNKYFPFRTDARTDYLRDLCFLAGFFPNEMQYGEKYVKLMTESTKSFDLLGIWSPYMEEWFIHRYAKDALISNLIDLEPWRLDDSDINQRPWSAALEGKRVLVIHPFSESIYSQYQNNREKLFSGLQVKNILPNFELIVLKAIQTQGDETSEYKDWFEALDYMKSQIKKIDFDVAIIGCGAYGYPLASFVKDMGKGAIHLGGATQMMFGVYGERWSPKGKGIYLDRMINEYWIRPSENEKIRNSQKIEGGCYW